jgi:NADH-quinone oxidoreductase subunit M
MGLFSLHHLAFQGAVLLSITFGLAAATLSLVTGMIYRRTRTTRLDKLGGLFDHIPLIGITFFIAGLSIIGMPGTPGFDAVHLVLEASIARFGGLLTIAAALGNVLAAGFLLWAFQRAFLSPMPVQGTTGSTIEPARPSELLVVGLIVVVLLSTGFHITPLMELIEMPLEAISHLYPGE